MLSFVCFISNNVDLLEKYELPAFSLEAEHFQGVIFVLSSFTGELNNGKCLLYEENLLLFVMFSYLSCNRLDFVFYLVKGLPFPVWFFELNCIIIHSFKKNTLKLFSMILA